MDFFGWLGIERLGQQDHMQIDNPTKSECAEPVHSSIQSGPLRLLQFVPEPLPTYRPDVATLFGKFLPRDDITCDVVGMASSASAQLQGFGRSFRPTFHPSRMRREAAYSWLTVRVLFAARAEHYAAVQVRDMVPTGLLALCISRIKGVPFFYWMSYLMSEGRIERARYSLTQRRTLRNYLVLWKGLVERTVLYKLVLPAADHVFVQSDAMLDYVEKKGISAARMTAVPMGVDTDLLSERSMAPRRLPGWENIPLVAYLGTLDKSRQLERLVDALVLLRGRHTTAKLLLIGNSNTPTDEVDLLSYARQRGVADAIHITGWLPSAEAWQLLSAADAAVSYVPRGELYDVSSPTKLLEYLALGIPSVGNDIPDQAFILGNSNAGWLTDSTPATIADALDDILRDPAKARLRAGNGPAYIEAQRSYRVLGERLSTRYRSLLRIRK